MMILIAGLTIFLAVHSVRIVADGWRSAQVARIGLLPWKGLYSLVSLAGFALVIWGYGMTRARPELWHPPQWLHYPAALLMLLSFVLFAAAYLPRNRIKAAIGHPMIVGVKVWALAHLLTNGRPGDVVLFGAFLVWAVFDFRAARARDRISGRSYAAGTVASDVAVLAIAAIAWFVFVRLLHMLLIGVQVM